MAQSFRKFLGLFTTFYLLYCTLSSCTRGIFFSMYLWLLQSRILFEFYFCAFEKFQLLIFAKWSADIEFDVLVYFV